MGIRFQAVGGGDTISLEVKSVVGSVFQILSKKGALAQENERSCRLSIRGEINRSGDGSLEALEALTKWASQCNRFTPDCYRQVEVEQFYAENYYRKVTFPQGRLVLLKESFLTDNSKFLTVELWVEQKESCLDEITITY